LFSEKQKLGLCLVNWEWWWYWFPQLKAQNDWWPRWVFMAYKFTC